MSFSVEEIGVLKETVKTRLSEKRFLHTLGVLQAAEKLAGYYAPEYIPEVKVAALLHDITKELPFDVQCELINDSTFKISKTDFENPAILHSFSAPTLIKRDFPKFATEKVLSAVFNHTVGSPDMSVLDEIIFLADFIEETRKYDSCVNLRNFVWCNITDNLQSNLKLLHTACVKAIDFTILNLIENKKKHKYKKHIDKKFIIE